MVGGRAVRGAPRVGPVGRRGRAHRGRGGKELPGTAQHGDFRSATWVVNAITTTGVVERFTPDGGSGRRRPPPSTRRATSRSRPHEGSVKSGGEWISSVDVENMIMSTRRSSRRRSIGVPHPKWVSARSRASCRARPTLEPAEIVDFLRPGSRSGPSRTGGSSRACRRRASEVRQEGPARAVKNGGRTMVTPSRRACSVGGLLMLHAGGARRPRGPWTDQLDEPARPHGRPPRVVHPTGVGPRPLHPPGGGRAAFVGRHQERRAPSTRSIRPADGRHPTDGARPSTPGVRPPASNAASRERVSRPPDAMMSR